MRDNFAAFVLLLSSDFIFIAVYKGKYWIFETYFSTLYITQHSVRYLGAESKIVRIQYSFWSPVCCPIDSAPRDGRTLCPPPTKPSYALGTWNVFGYIWNLLLCWFVHAADQDAIGTHKQHLYCPINYLPITEYVHIYLLIRSTMLGATFTRNSHWLLSDTDSRVTTLDSDVISEFLLPSEERNM